MDLPFIGHRVNTTSVSSTLHKPRGKHRLAASSQVESLQCGVLLFYQSVTGKMKMGHKGPKYFCEQVIELM